jgi:type IV pilus assembly protein PilM
MESMMGRMMGGGMYGQGMSGDAEAKKKMTLLTRTDFLIQFLWKPVPPEEFQLPDDPEQRKVKIEEQAAKVKEMADKMREAEKNNSAVTIPTAEEIEKTSIQQTKDLESAITKALQAAPAPTATAPGGAGTAPPATSPGTPTAPAPAGAAPAATGKAP